MGLWDQIRHALSAVWAEIQRPSVDEQTQRVIWLTQSGRAEHGLSIQIQQLIPAIPYEQFRQRLEVMACDDERHATLIQQYLGTLGWTAGVPLGAGEDSKNTFPRGPWLRLQRVLTDKRNLYEGYRQEASATDDPSLQSLLERVRDDEVRHQEELIAILMQLDAHVHETIT